MHRLCKLFQISFKKLKNSLNMLLRTPHKFYVDAIHKYTHNISQYISLPHSPYYIVTPSLVVLSYQLNSRKQSVCIGHKNYFLTLFPFSFHSKFLLKIAQLTNLSLCDHRKVIKIILKIIKCKKFYTHNKS